MKVKEAITQLEGLDKQYQALCQLFMDESKSRITLRAAGKKPSPGVVSSVVEEMKLWVVKVGQGLRIEERWVTQIVNLEPARVYLEYGINSPEFEHAIKMGRLAQLKGLPPITEITVDDIDAMAAWSMARMFKDFENMGEEKIREGLEDSKGVPDDQL